MTLIVFLCLLCWNFPSKMPYTDRASFGVTSFDLPNSSSPSPPICSQSNMVSIETRGRQRSRNGAALIPCLGSSLFLGLQLSRCRDLGVPQVHKAPFTSLQKKKNSQDTHNAHTHTLPVRPQRSDYCSGPNSPGRSWLRMSSGNSQTSHTYNPTSRAAEMHYLPDSITEIQWAFAKSQFSAICLQREFWSSLFTPFKTACSSGRQRLSRAAETVKSDKTWLWFPSSFVTKFSLCNSV